MFATPLLSYFSRAVVHFTLTTWKKTGFHRNSGEQKIHCSVGLLFNNQFCEMSKHSESRYKTSGQRENREDDREIALRELEEARKKYEKVVALISIVSWPK